MYVGPEERDEAGSSQQKWTCSLFWWNSMKYENRELEREFVSYDRVTARLANRVMYGICIASIAFIAIADVFIRPELASSLRPWRLSMIAVAAVFVAAQFWHVVERRSHILIHAPVLWIGVAVVVISRITGESTHSPYNVGLILQAGLTMLVVPHATTVVWPFVICTYCVLDKIIFEATTYGSVLVTAVSLLILSMIGVVVTFFNELYRRRAFLGLRVLATEIEDMADEEELKKNLLANILPASILSKIDARDVDGGQFDGVVDAYNEVTCMFCDVQGVEEYCGDKAGALVEVLDDIFSTFDELTDAHHVEKIKTIGTVYMAVSGCPVRTRAHAKNIAEFAFAIRAAVAVFNVDHGSHLKCMIGVNTGSVVAGVVGKHRFVFDLWGDAVNVASRMESHGLADEIQITMATKDLLGGDYDYVDRGSIEVKGKGAMRAFLLKMKLTMGNVRSNSSSNFLSARGPKRTSLRDYIGAKRQPGDSTTRSGLTSDRMRGITSRTVRSARTARSSVGRSPLTRFPSSVSTFSVKSGVDFQGAGPLDEDEENAEVEETHSLLQHVEKYKTHKITMQYHDPALETAFLHKLYDEVGVQIFNVLLRNGALLFTVVVAIDLFSVLVITPEFGARGLVIVIPSAVTVVVLLMFSAIGARPFLSPRGRLRMGQVVVFIMASALHVRLLVFPKAAQYLQPMYIVSVFTYYASYSRLRLMDVVAACLYLFVNQAALPPILGTDAEELSGTQYINLTLLYMISLVVTLSSKRAVENSERKAFVLHMEASVKRATTAASKMQSDLLLINVLPEEIAHDLMTGEMSISRQFECGSLLVFDVVQFTVLSSKIRPSELVGILNALFHRVDDLVDHWDCEKIKTIGDCYVAGAGLLSSSVDAPFRACALGMDVLAAVKEVCTLHNIKFDIRIGIHSGPVVGGVVGKKKFAWDLWGATVDTAFAMEAGGEAGKVHVSEATRLLVEDFFEMEEVEGEEGEKAFRIISRKGKDSMGEVMDVSMKADAL